MAAVWMPAVGASFSNGKVITLTAVSFLRFGPSPKGRATALNDQASEIRLAAAVQSGVGMKAMATIDGVADGRAVKSPAGTYTCSVRGRCRAKGDAQTARSDAALRWDELGVGVV
jgi:hypothetical protein